MCAFQVLCTNLFFGPLTFFHWWIHNLGSQHSQPPPPRPCLLPAQIGYARGQARAYSPSFPLFWCGKIDQSQVLWSVASCDANDKIESLLQKVELRSTLRNMLPQLATSKFVAWQVESEGGNTGNNAFQLATQQCCATSCAKMLPVLLDLKQVSTRCKNFPHKLTCQILTTQNIKIGRRAWSTRDTEKSQKRLPSLHVNVKAGWILVSEIRSKSTF